MAPAGARVSASASSVSSSHSGCRTAASAARLAAAPVSDFSCVSLPVEPAGRSRSERGAVLTPAVACSMPLRARVPPPSLVARFAATSTSSSRSAASAMLRGRCGGG
eukprot:3753467-Pleurochrysis_carterae.AAC.1